GLAAIDLITRAVKWQAEGWFQGSPAIGGDTVYAVTQGFLEAYDAMSGEPMGVFISSEPLMRQQPIVTDDAVIVRSDDATHIFDRVSRAEVLTIPVAGHLSLANDTLFIAGDEKLSAYELSTQELAWHNAENPNDVNADGFVSPLDALAVINRLITHGPGPLETPSTTPTFYVDVIGDNVLSPLDALQVIQGLNDFSQAEPAVRAASSLSTQTTTGLDGRLPLIPASAGSTLNPWDHPGISNREPFQAARLADELFRILAEHHRRD
ncbi:MAG: dockerin type I domain-containing protein, partial [Planctomycetota bacterium]